MRSYVLASNVDVRPKGNVRCVLLRPKLDYLHSSILKAQIGSGLHAAYVATTSTGCTQATSSVFTASVAAFLLLDLQHLMSGHDVRVKP